MLSGPLWLILNSYQTGGQAKNIILMNLLANTCNISVILPHSHSAAVVAGAAMLGRVAYQIRNILKGGELKSQRDVDECSAKFGGTLWDIMVRAFSVCVSLFFPQLNAIE
jgi:ribulose kinase